MPPGGTRSAPSLIRPGTQRSRPGAKEGPLLAAAGIALSTGQPADSSAHTSAESRTSGAAPAVPRAMTSAQAWDEKTAPLTASTRPGSRSRKPSRSGPPARAGVCRSDARAGTAAGEALDSVGVWGKRTCRRTGAGAPYSPQPTKPLTILMLQKGCSNPHAPRLPDTPIFRRPQSRCASGPITQAWPWGACAYA